MQPPEQPYSAVRAAQQLQQHSHSAQSPPVSIQPIPANLTPSEAAVHTHGQSAQQPASGPTAHMHANHAHDPSHAPNPAQYASSPLASHSATAPHHQHIPEASGRLMPSSEPEAYPQAPEAAQGNADSMHSDYSHPAAVPENAHMRPDIAHAHLRPPVTPHYDSQLLYGLTGQLGTPVASQAATPTAPNHSAETSSAPQEHIYAPQSVQPVPAPVPATHVLTHSPPPPTPPQQQQQQYCELPYAPEAPMATPSMHGWPQVRSSGSLVRSVESQAELERARAAAAERAGVH